MSWADDVSLVDLTFTTDFQRDANIIKWGKSGPPAGQTDKDLRELNLLSRILLANPQLTFPPPPTPQPNQRSMQVNAAKVRGNELYKAKEWQEAIKLYTISAEIAASRPVFEANVYARDELALSLSNRSAAYLAAGEFVNALVDADAVISIKRAWTKGHFRRGKALEAMGRLEEAREAILLGLQFDPSSDDLITEAAEVEKKLREKIEKK